MQDQTTHERAAQPTGSARLDMNGNVSKLAGPPPGQSSGGPSGLLLEYGGKSCRLDSRWLLRPTEADGLRSLEWRDGVRVACLLPAYRPGSPAYYRRVAAKAEVAGDVRRAREFREAAVSLEMKEEARALGADVYSAIYAARLMAAMLRSRRPLPRGATALEAQLALENWLPAMRREERALVLEILRGCTAKRLGKRLGEMVAAEPAIKPARKGGVAA